MAQLEFTPLEFETWWANRGDDANSGLEFTPLEFETQGWAKKFSWGLPIRIYSVGVWNNSGEVFLANSDCIRIYSVGVWNNV